MKSIHFLLVSLFAFGLSACTDMQPMEPNEPAIPGDYHLSIRTRINPGTRGVTFEGNDISSQFSYSDKIFIYNKTRDALARHWNGETYVATPLKPEAGSISSDGRSCSLSGDLSFVKWADTEWVKVIPESGDDYCLYYLMNEPDYSFQGASHFPRFDYSEQDGSAASASRFDFAEAAVVMDLSGKTLSTPSAITFTRLQSMFRQALSYTKAGAPFTPASITKLTVSTENGTLLSYLNPTFGLDDPNHRYGEFSIDIYNPVISEGNLYLSLAFHYPDAASKADRLKLTATDSEGNIYIGSKDVPDGGFLEEKYYYGSMEMVWDRQMIRPAVSRADGGDTDELEPDEDGLYDICQGTAGDIDVTVSGPSSGYRVYLNDVPAIVTLTGEDNPVSASWNGNNAFIESDEDLTLVLGCNYAISSPLYRAAIECGANLKLKTTGDTQTLTVVTNDDGSIFAEGIYGSSNYDAHLSTSVENLAAEGFTVTREGPVSNGDDTYTWVFTVSPIPPYTIVDGLGGKRLAYGEVLPPFQTSANVYVKNYTKNTLDGGVHHPVSGDVESLFAGKLNNSNYAAKDSLILFYNTDSAGKIDYSAQDGSAENVKDAGIGGSMVVSASEGAVSSSYQAEIQNLQSLFQFTFRYSGQALSGIRFVRIFSENDKLQATYNAVTGATTYGPVTISRDTDLPDDYVYAGLRLDKTPEDPLVFQVVASDGKVYSGSMNAPAEGFENGCYYPVTVDVNLYTFTVASGKKVCFSPGDLGLERINNENVYSFTVPFTNWGQGNTTNYNNATAAAAVAQRTWFDFYFESGLREGFSLYGITNWRIPTRLGSNTNTYEWNYIVDSRPMNEGVERYYKVTIPGHQYCSLLPPDETLSSDIGEDLISGTVSDYINYLGKGFVLLFNTNRAIYSKSWSWGSSTSSYTQQGWYWTWYNSSSRYYFTWSSSGPACSYMSNRMRNHIRYVHDVTLP